MFNFKRVILKLINTIKELSYIYIIAFTASIIFFFFNENTINISSSVLLGIRVVCVLITSAFYIPGFWIKAILLTIEWVLFNLIIIIINILLKFNINLGCKYLTYRKQLKLYELNIFSTQTDQHDWMHKLMDWVTLSYDLEWDQIKFYIVNLAISLIILNLLLLLMYWVNKKIIDYDYLYITTSTNWYLISLLFIILNSRHINFTTFINWNANNFPIIKNITTITLNNLNISFALTVLIISLFVNIYQTHYMKDDYKKNNFFVYLNLFIISMLIVVISDNWILLLFGWELLGLTSFFLIGFFKTKTSSFKSAFKAMVFNRISDVSLLVAALICYAEQNSILITQTVVNSQYQTIVLLLIFFTASIKSAQLIFYYWLPDSMDAPIPASALIHSATLVSAGFYLLIKFSIVMEVSYIINAFMLTFSLISMILFSFIASKQTDVKKLLAFSTISNCAFIYTLINLKLYNVSIMYFTFHGFIKSLLFLTAGILILVNNHYQDIRKWSSYNLASKLINTMLLLCLLILAVLPIGFAYELKQSVYNLNCNSFLKLLLMVVIVLFYSLNSYNYGIKCSSMYFEKRNYISNFSKNKINTNQLKFITLILVIYLVIIFLFTLSLQYILTVKLSTVNVTYVLWIWLVNIIITRKIIVNKKYILMTLLIPLILILL